MAEFDRSRLKRAWGLSKLGARVALKQGRRLVTKNEQSIHEELARSLVKELGKLKGLPMKIGQILSYMDGVVPAEYEGIYHEILGELRTQSTPIAEDAWRRVLEEELGRPTEELFDQFDSTPIASASIGQVHRAVFRGQSVCVKIQYPGIAEATENDLENVEMIVKLMRQVLPNVDTRQMITDFRIRLAEECDYLKEAAYQQRFAEIYSNDAGIIVPAVVTERSTLRVLTTAFVDGQSFEPFVANSSPEERNRAGRALFRFAFGTLLEHGLFHADPHPGNLLFRVGESARLAILDYGCVQPVDDEARRDMGVLLEAAVEGEPLADKAQVALGIAEMDDVTRDVVTKIVAEILAPITAPQPYRFTRTFAANVSRSVIEAKMSLASRYMTRRGRFVAEREGVMFVVRNLFGLASIWGTLEAEGDYRSIARAMIQASRYDEE